MESYRANKSINSHLGKYFSGLKKGSRRRRIAILGTCTATAVALLGLIAYIPGLGLLGSVREDYIPMAPSTAISFLLLSLLVLNLPVIKNRLRRIGSIFALLVSIFGFLEVVGFYLNMDLNFEDAIIPEFGTLGSIPVARMSPSTGALFFLSGLATFGLIMNSSRIIKLLSMKHAPGALGTVTVFLSLIFLLAYAYGTPLLYGQGATVPMALTTAFAFLMLSSATVASSNRDTIPLKYFTQKTTQAQLLRVFFPLTILAVLVGTLAMLVAPMLSIINAAFISAAAVVFVAIITGIVVNRVSKILGDSIDRVEAEREELGKRKDQFVTMTSHEIRTPLTVLRGYLDILLKSKDELSTSKVITIINTMHKNCVCLESLVKTVGNVSEYEKGIFQIDSSVIELDSFIHGAIDQHKFLLHDQLTLDLSEISSGVLFKGDLSKLTQVLDNLIDNAIRNTSELNRKLIFKTEIWVKKITIHLLDNGTGISENNLEQIFEQFVSIPTEYHVGGMGVGLYISRKIAEAHGGTLLCRSKGLGHGAEFILELPRF